LGAMPTPDVIVYYDYLCPFAWRGAELAGLVASELGLDFRWRLFSLVQSNSKDPGFQIWNEKIDHEDPTGSGGLLPFLASLAARRQGLDAENVFRLNLQRERFTGHRAFSCELMLEVADRSGLDLQRFRADLGDPELRTQLAQEHHEAEQLNVFGTPTFRFLDSGATAYLRIRELPRDSEEAVDLFDRYRSLLTDYPWLETVKRPRNGGN